ncbi:MAG: MBL fold metallo-hydrolase, partial [Pseudomonadota bacterium]
LEEIGVKKLDYILLTHIHIDHAGGTGKLLNAFPDAKVLCHPKGIEHMLNPGKLWEGSLKILGEIANAYGEIVSVPQGCIFFEKNIKRGNDTIEVIETPGHAPHHVSYAFKQYLFAGEVAGVYQPLPDKMYLRPATPPKFKLKISLSSLEKVLTKNPEMICFGHYGFHKEPFKMLTLAKEQLVLWTEVIKEQRTGGEEATEKKIIERLMEKDQTFFNYQYLDGDIKARENYFVINSIKGMKEYVNGVIT